MYHIIDDLSMLSHLRFQAELNQMLSSKLVGKELETALVLATHRV